ncbi:MAG: helix-turn-helix transcriptional regulator [Bacillota bacterium]
MKALRIDNDISQKELAEALGTTRQQIYKYETGIQEMTVSKLKTLCEFYQVSSDYVLGLPKHLHWPR